MAAFRKFLSLPILTSISSSFSSLWKKTKDGHDSPPTPNAVEMPLQQLRSSDDLHPGGPTQGDDVIHGADFVIDVEAPPPVVDANTNPSTQLGLKRRSPQLPASTPALPSASVPTENYIDSSSKHIRKMVGTVAIFLITFSGLLIVNPPDINLMNDSLTKSMASVSDVLVLITFCFGAWLILHCLMCVHPSDHLNDIWIQKYLMLMGVVFMALSLLFRTLVTPSSTLLVLVSWVLALLIVVLAFAFLQMVSHKFTKGTAAPKKRVTLIPLAAGGVGNLPV